MYGLEKVQATLRSIRLLLRPADEGTQAFLVTGAGVEPTNVSLWG